MPIIQKAFMDSILTTHTIHDKVLQYTGENTEQKKERLIGTLNKLINVL